MLNDVLREYLVSLGFSVNTNSYNKFNSALNKADKAINDFSITGIKAFAKAEVSVAAFGALVASTMYELTIHLAQTDLQNVLFARRMWMNVDAAKAYQSSISALGVSLQDLYLNPELMSKYLELHKESMGMMPSGDYEAQMRGVRDITFEFQRLKLEGTYALQWIGYYLVKYLAGPLKDVKAWLKDTNDTIQQKMPQWTAKVAQVLSMLERLGVAAWHIRDALAAITMVLLAPKLLSIMTSPWGMIIAGFGTLLLLVDDFYGYNAGKQSALPGLWKEIDKFGDSLKANGLGIKTFKDDILGIATSIYRLINAIDGLLNKSGAEGGLQDILENGLLATLRDIDDTIRSITGGINGLSDLISGKINGSDVWKSYTDALKKQDDANPDTFTSQARNFFRGIYEFFADHPVNLFPSSISPMSYSPASSIGYLYPQNHMTNSNTKVENSPTYNIYGAKDPGIVAKTIDTHQAGLLTRYMQGVRLV